MRNGTPLRTRIGRWPALVFVASGLLIAVASAWWFLDYRADTSACTEATSSLGAGELPEGSSTQIIDGDCVVTLPSGETRTFQLSGWWDPRPAWLPLAIGLAGIAGSVALRRHEHS